MKKLFRPLVLGGILLLAVGLAPVMDTTPARAATGTDANLKQMLEDLLRDHPESVLDVLRSHSEDVLDIAQAGANARRKAALEAQRHTENFAEYFTNKFRIFLCRYKCFGLLAFGNQTCQIDIVRTGHKSIFRLMICICRQGILFKQ